MEIKELSIANYSVYIENHDCVRSLQHDVKQIDEKVDSLVEVLPSVADLCGGFAEEVPPATSCVQPTVE